MIRTKRLFVSQPYVFASDMKNKFGTSNPEMFLIQEPALNDNNNQIVFVSENDVTNSHLRSGVLRLHINSQNSGVPDETYLINYQGAVDLLAKIGGLCSLLSKVFTVCFTGVYMHQYLVNLAKHLLMFDKYKDHQ